MKLAENKTKSYCLEFKIEGKHTEQRKLRRFAGLAERKRRLLVADWTWSGVSSPQPPAIATRHKYWTCNGVVGGQYRDCTGIRMRE